MVLRSWHRRGPLAIPGVDPVTAVRFGGRYVSKGFAFETDYNQVWARASASNYRLALVNDAVRGFDLASADLARVHADHVLARSRVREYPDAWVLMFPVHAGSNSPFGAIEKRLGPVDMEVEYVKLDPLIGLKLFCGSLPRDTGALQWTMRDVRGQFDTLSPFAEHFCRRMEREASKYVAG